MSLNDIEFSLLLFTDTVPVTPISYTALKMYGGTASFTGVPDPRARSMCRSASS
jgi:hypothetical protein